MSEWKEVNAGADDYWDRKNPIEGVLVEKKENNGQYNTTLYVIETKEGKNVGVNGTTVIDNKMSKVQIGQEVRIEPLGEAKSKTGNRTYQDFKVMTRELPFKEVDEDQAIKDAVEEIPF